MNFVNLMVFKDYLIGAKEHKYALEFMDNLVHVVLEQLKDKLVICQNLLVLCFEYCVKFNEKLKQEFIKSLEFKSEMKQRNYAWFKQFLLMSNLWLTKVNVSSNSGSSNNSNNIMESKQVEDNNDKNNKKDRLLYDLIDETVDKLLITQQKFIKRCIEDEKNSELQ